jgi:hypothetical protein
MPSEARVRIEDIGQNFRGEKNGVPSGAVIRRTVIAALPSVSAEEGQQRIGEAAVNGKSPAKVPKPLRAEQTVVLGDPVQHLVEEARIASGNLGGEEQQGLRVGGPVIRARALT